MTKLSLAGTAVDDAALKNIEGLTNLMSINLYNTKVTDAGLALSRVRKKKPTVRSDRRVDRDSRFWV